MSPAASNIDTKFYRKSSQALSGAVDLDADTARVFAAIEGNIQLSRVAELAEVNMAALWKAIAKLIRLGLVECADGDAGFMGRLFADAVEKEFAKAVGPIGIILLQKAAAQMDISLPNIPAERAREFVDRLVAQIPDQKGRAEFQQAILKKI